MGSLVKMFKAIAPEQVQGVARSALRGAETMAADFRDGVDLLRGKRDPLVPPRRMWSLVTGRGADFRTTGQQLADLMIAYGLSADHAVLDVGCGIGRAAVPLTAYLSPQGSYDGVDIMPDAISWCAQAITPRFPRFHFHLADVESQRYHHAQSARSASDYVFPFADESFDFVFLGSVFTHMFPAGMRNYLREIARVMRPGACSVISYYLWDEARADAVARGEGAFSFAHVGDGYRAEFPELPEAAIAFARAEILSDYAALSLEVVAERAGAWPFAKVQDQDILVARKGGGG